MKLSAQARGVVVMVLAAFALVACSPLPYQTSVPKSVARDLKRQSGQAGTTGPAPKAIALCYSDMINTPQDLMEEARLICGDGSPRYLGTDTFWTSCSVLQPARATFLCAPTSE